MLSITYGSNGQEIETVINALHEINNAVSRLSSYCSNDMLLRLLALEIEHAAPGCILHGYKYGLNANESAFEITLKIK